MTRDPITFEVIKNFITAATEEMEVVLLKSAYSPIIKELLDASCGIGDRDDAACYADAERRIKALGTADPQTKSLAAVMFEIAEARRSTKKERRGR